MVDTWSTVMAIGEKPKILMYFKGGTDKNC